MNKKRLILTKKLKRRRISWWCAVLIGDFSVPLPFESSRTVCRWRLYGVERGKSGQHRASHFLM